jgi:hypothetical protein
MQGKHVVILRSCGCVMLPFLETLLAVAYPPLHCPPALPDFRPTIYRSLLGSFRSIYGVQYGVYEAVLDHSSTDALKAGHFSNTMLQECVKPSCVSLRDFWHPLLARLTLPRSTVRVRSPGLVRQPSPPSARASRFFGTIELQCLKALPIPVPCRRSLQSSSRIFFYPSMTHDASLTALPPPDMSSSVALRQP